MNSYGYFLKGLVTFLKFIQMLPFGVQNQKGYVCMTKLALRLLLPLKDQNYSVYIKISLLVLLLFIGLKI